MEKPSCYIDRNDKSRSEQGLRLARGLKPHRYELSMTLLSCRSFLPFPKRSFEENIEEICNIGQYSILSGNKFLREYKNGMRRIYDRRHTDRKIEYTCTVDFDLFKKHAADCVSPATFARNPNISPYYFTNETFDRFCDAQNQDIPEELNEQAAIMRDFCKDIRATPGMYDPYIEMMEQKGKKASAADLFVYQTGLFIRYAVAERRMKRKAGGIVYVPDSFKEDYMTVADYFDEKGHLCAMPLTSILRDPGALLNLFLEEKSDQRKKSLEFEQEKEAKNGVSYLKNKIEIGRQQAIVEEQNLFVFDDEELTEGASHERVPTPT